MRNILLFAGLILAIALVLGCTGSEQKVVCNKPYILVGTDCCLDNNNNSICDKDETQTQATQPAEPAEPEAPATVTENKTVEACSTYGCMADKPKFCMDNNVLYACLTCGCQTPGMRCDNVTGKCSEDCTDGTKYGQCSASKPKYCSNGELTDNCDKCSCPTGQNCKADGKCTSGALVQANENVPFNVYAWGELEWGLCSRIDGSWDAAREFCKCKGYDDVVDYGTGNSCYVVFTTSNIYEWGDLSECDMSHGVYASGADGAVAMIKCQTYG